MKNNSKGSDAKKQIAINPTPPRGKFRLDVFFRHVKDSLKSLKRNGWMSFAAVSAVAITLTLVGVFMALLMNVNHISGQVENDVRIRVLVTEGTNKKDRDALAEKLKETKNVAKVTYRSPEEEMDQIVKTYGKDWKALPGDKNVLLEAYLVETEKPDQVVDVAKKIKKYKNVESAEYGGDSADNLFRIANIVRTWGLGLTALLLFVAVFLIYNTIRITIFSRQSEISVMRLVGATNNFIRAPFLLEGAWTGLLGSILPIVLVDVGYTLVLNTSSFSTAGNGFALYPAMPFLLWLDLLIAFIGIVIGGLGAVLSMRKFLKV